MSITNVFNRPSVVRAFARGEKILGGQSFRLDDGRTLTGVGSRIHRGETFLSNGTCIEADSVIVATRPQFTPAGGKEALPEALKSTLAFEGQSWRVEYVASDEIHVSLYLCRNPLRPSSP